MGYHGNDKQDAPMYFAPFPPLEENGTTGDDGQDNKSPNYIPDPKKHLIVSLTKSIVRIAGYALLFGIPSGWAVAAATVLIISEAIGVVEELV